MVRWRGCSVRANGPLNKIGSAKKMTAPFEELSPDGSASGEVRALDELHRRLTVGHYDEGRLPPERELAEELGVSRRALRQALAALEEEGLIWRRQGHGTFISTHPMVTEAVAASLANRVSPMEVMEARLSIEPMLVGRSALRMSKAQIDHLNRLATSARNAADARTYETFDMAFHRKIAEGAGNALLLAIFETVIGVREMGNWRRVREYYFEHDGTEISYREHKLIIEAIGDRDASQAEAFMREHLSQVAKIVLGTVAVPLDAG